jgi:hypothetical protein
MSDAAEDVHNFGSFRYRHPHEKDGETQSTRPLPPPAVTLAGTAAALAILSGGGVRARAATINSTWVTGNNGNWSNPANWSNNPAAATYPNNGNLGNVYNAALASGTAVLDVGVRLASLTVSGAVILPPASAVAPGTNVLVAQEFTFSSGRLMVPSTATANGHLTLTNPAGTKVLGGTLTILGKANLAGTSGAYVVSASGTNAAIAQAGFFEIERPLTLDDDLVAPAQNYNRTNQFWAEGDFTNDGAVNFDDLVKLSQNYNTAMPDQPIPSASPAFASDLAAAFASVPEPGALSTLTAAAGFAVLARRPRRRRKH